MDVRILRSLPAFLTLVAVCGALAAEPQKITTVEGITEYRLDNGLKVLLFPDASKDTVTVAVTYFVGSRHEGYGETGMAHLLEHMVFKGTPDHPQIWKSLQDHGAQFNGTTSFDRTNYFETLAASPQNLEFALAMEADRMVNSFIAQKDLESEFSVVRNEFEMGENSPVGVLEERIWSTAYLWHNYGKSTIGSREDIERVPIERLQAFYKKYYQPDNAMLVVAGKLDLTKTLARINELFGRIPRPQRALEKTYTVEPPQDGEREVTLRRVGDVQAVGALYHICPGAHEDMPALQVLADVLDTEQTGRLHKALVETGLATRVRASAQSLCDPGAIVISAEARVDKPLDQIRKVLIDTVEALAASEITTEDVDRAKNAFAKNFELSMANSGRIAVGLSEWASRGDWRLIFLHRDRMKNVTPADVQRVAATYLKSSNRTVGTFTPTKDIDRTTPPPAPDLAAILKDYRGSSELARGEEFEATPENIEARSQRTELPGGVKLAMPPKKTRGERVNVAITLHYGSEATLAGRTEAASFVAPMLSQGTSKHTKRQLRDELDRLKANVSISSGGGMMGGRGGRFMGAGQSTPGTISVSIDTVRANLPAVIALAGEMLRDPAFPQSEFDKMHRERLAQSEQGRSEPTALAGIALRRKMSPYGSDDIRYVPTIDEQIERLKAVTLADVKRIYTELVGAGHGQAAAVGDFDPAELTNALGSILTDWKSPLAYQRIEMPHHPTTPDKIVISTPDKKNAMMIMGTSLPVRDDDPDHPALTMANFILGGSSNSRLMNRLRQKEGLSYGCGSMLAISSEDRSGMLRTYGICAPENTEKAVQFACEEMTRLCKEGITQPELDAARKGYLEQFKVGLSNDGSLTGTLARQLYLGRTMTFTIDQLKRIEALSVDDVNAAIRKYFNPDSLVIVRAGDFTS